MALMLLPRHLVHALTSVALALGVLLPGRTFASAPVGPAPSPDPFTQAPPAIEPTDAREVPILRVEGSEDEVVLLDGSFGRGKVLELAKGSHVTISVAGEPKRFAWSELQEIRLGTASAPTAATTAPSEPAPPAPEAQPSPASFSDLGAPAADDDESPPLDPLESKSSKSTGEGLRMRRGYLNIAPGVLNFNLSGAGFGVVPAFLYGLDGGYHLPLGRAFALQVGGFFEHAARPDIQRFRLGPMVRIGRGNEKIFGYGLVRLGVEIVHVDVVFYGVPIRGTSTGFHGAFGGGLMGMVHRSVSLGGEAYVDVLAAGGSAAAFMNFRFMVGIWF